MESNDIVDAAGSGDIATVKNGIEYRPLSVHDTNEAGWTPLHAAAANGWLEIATVLLQAGAEIDAESITHQTSLHLAASGRFLPIIDLLSKCGANINATDARNDTPLTLAAGFRPADLDASNLLISHGANLDFHSAVVLGRISEAICMIHSDPTNISDQISGDLIVFATIWQSPELVQLLLQYSIDLTRNSSFGEPPLHFISNSSLVPKSEITAIITRLLRERNNTLFQTENRISQ